MDRKTTLHFCTSHYLPIYSMKSFLSGRGAPEEVVLDPVNMISYTDGEFMDLHDVVGHVTKD